MPLSHPLLKFCVFCANFEEKNRRRISNIPVMSNLSFFRILFNFYKFHIKKNSDFYLCFEKFSSSFSAHMLVIPRVKNRREINKVSFIKIICNSNFY